MNNIIVGHFSVKTENAEIVLNSVLNTAQADDIKFGIAHGGEIPKCHIGRDKNGVSIVALDGKLWRRQDYGVHNIHDLHSAAVVYGFDRPGPGAADIPHTLTEGNINFCKNKYSIQLLGLNQ